MLVAHLLTSCSAYSDLRAGVNPELVLEDRDTFLTRAIARRKVLELKLRNEQTEQSRAKPARE